MKLWCTEENDSSFLRDDNNKTELFQLLAERIQQAQTTSTIHLTKKEDVIRNDNQKSLEAVSPNLREEAGTIIYVHPQDAAVRGSTILVIKTNDIAIVLIAWSAVAQW